MKMKIDRCFYSGAVNKSKLDARQRIRARASVADARMKLTRRTGTTFQKSVDARTAIGQRRGITDARQKLLGKNTTQDLRVKVNNKKAFDARNKLSRKRKTPQVTVTGFGDTNSTTLQVRTYFCYLSLFVYMQFDAFFLVFR